MNLLWKHLEQYMTYSKDLVKVSCYWWWKESKFHQLQEEIWPGSSHHIIEFGTDFQLTLLGNRA